MRHLRPSVLILLLVSGGIACQREEGTPDYSGVYCLNIQNLEMTIVQAGGSVTFTIPSTQLTNGTGTVNGNVVVLTANATEGDTFSASLTFSDDGQTFSGPFQIVDSGGRVTTGGVLLGSRGECAEYDVAANGVPRFVSHDYTELAKIEMISRFRSGIGHSFTDGAEACRSMKHYYAPYEGYRENKVVEIDSPVDGTIVSVPNDGHGASIGLNNKQIHIKPDAQPAFVFVIFHCDLVSADIAVGRHVRSGELIGHARLYYEDIPERANSFDIAVWVNTPSGNRLVPYFDTMNDAAFAGYVARGASSRQAFSITREERDADPLQCQGEQFVTGGHLENWVVLR